MTFAEGIVADYHPSGMSDDRFAVGLDRDEESSWIAEHVHEGARVPASFRSGSSTIFECRPRMSVSTNGCSLTSAMSTTATSPLASAVAAAFISAGIPSERAK
jgi:hypothetical protein